MSTKAIRRIKWLAVILVGIGLVGASFIGFDYLKVELDYQNFLNEGIQDAGQVEEELSIALETVQSVKSFYLSSEHVSNDEFDTFVGPILLRHPSIQAIEWVPMVEHKNRKPFEDLAKEVFPGFMIYEKTLEGKIAAQERDVYYPVRYIFPLKENESVLGYDLGSELIRLQTLEQARDTGQPSSTSKVSLVQGASTENGLLIFEPIIRGIPKDLHDRREMLQGFALAVFNIPSLLAGVETSGEHIKLNLYEPDEIIPDLEDTFYYNKVINFANRNWVVSISTQKYHVSSYVWLPYMAATIVGLLYLLCFTIFYSLRTRNKIAKRLIAEKTNELTYFNKVLSSIQSVQKQFISGDSPERYFDKMLQDLLEFTDSEFGFIGEILYKDNQRYLRTVAITNIAWNYETRKFYSDNSPQGLEFTNLDTLFGAVIKTGEVVIANDPEHDSRSGGTPEGHPDLKAFLGVPFYAQNNFVGMAGVANREGGYNEEILKQLEGFLMNCGYIIHEFKIRREHQKIEAQNYTMARNDILTGLPNRVLFQEQANQLISLADRHKHKLALMFVDVDDFKPVNDTYGHDIGDMLLQNLAAAMRDHTRASDVIARFGGDEFAIVLPKISGIEDAELVAKKLIEFVSSPFMIANYEINIGLSIGIAMYPDNGCSLEVLLKQADRAMYQAKSKGKNKYITLTDDNLMHFEKSGKAS